MRVAFFGDDLVVGKPGVSFLPYLGEALPTQVLLSYGKAGDTVISLHRRLTRMEPGDPFDIAFLWVGIHDVLVHVSWTFPIVKRLRGQRWAKDNEEFGSYYGMLVALMCERAKKVITVPPLLIGEHLGNRWNRRLLELSRIIEQETSIHVNATYFNVLTYFRAELSVGDSSAYTPMSCMRSFLDALFLNTPEKVDRKSEARKLRYTLDGVHLNTQGARIVAGAFLRAIRDAIAKRAKPRKK